MRISKRTKESKTLKMMLKGILVEEGVNCFSLGCDTKRVTKFIQSGDCWEVSQILNYL